MNGYVSELFARERAADFEREAHKTALAQLARRTNPPLLSPVGRRNQILAVVKAATKGIGRRGEPSDRSPQRGSAIEA